MGDASASPPGGPGWKRFFWLVLLWLLGVSTLGLVTLALRLLMRIAGLTS